MFERNYTSLFRADNESHTANTARYHLLFNSRSSSKEKEETTRTEYEGFLNETYRKLAEERVAAYQRTDYLEEVAREAFLQDKALALASDVRSSTQDSGRIFKSFFSRFQMPESGIGMFGGDGEADREFALDTVNDLTGWLTQDRRSRQQSNVLPSYKFIDEQLDSLAAREISLAEQSSSQLNKEIDYFLKQSGETSSQIDEMNRGSNSLRRAKKLLTNQTYVTRPGIAPAVGLIGGATSELNIDIFQLQNKSVRDIISLKILQEASAFQKGERSQRFKVNVRMAMPVGERPGDFKTYDILGSNLMLFRELELLREELGEAVAIDYQYGGRRDHAKLLVSDNSAIIGSQNLTAPVGRSVFQAGSNYEVLRVLQLRSDRYSTAREVIAAGADRELNTESRLFMQAHAVMDRIKLNDPKRNLMQTGYGNIGGAGDTYSHLKATLNYASAHNDTSLTMLLNQVFLLQYDTHDGKMFDKQIQGEMGPEDARMLRSSTQTISQRTGQYRHLQRDFLNLLIEGRGSAIVDRRHYQESILDPFFSKLKAAGLLNAQNQYDPVRLVRQLMSGKMLGGTAQEKVSTLMGKGLGEDTAVQLLAITSGRIESGAVSMQHAKGYILMQGEKAVASNVGSSNLGLYSLGITGSDWEQKYVNNEMNLMFASGAVRDMMLRQKGQGSLGYGLSSDEEREELTNSTLLFKRLMSDMGRRQLGQLQYTNVRPDWHHSISGSGIEELQTRISEINKQVGFDLIKVNRDFDENRGRVSNLTVALDMYSLTGFAGRNINERLTVRGNFVYSIDRNKAYGPIEFANLLNTPVTTGWGREIGSQSREVFNSYETTVSYLGSLAYETMSLGLVKQPLIEFQNRFLGNRDQMQSGVANYLATLIGDSGISAKELLTVDSERFRKAAATLQSRLSSNGDVFMDRIRNFVGIDIEGRQSQVQQLVNLLNVFAANDIEGRAAMMSLPGQASLGDTFETLFARGDFADLLHDFVRAQRDSGYSYDLTQEVKSLQERAQSVFFTAGQVNTYAYSQGSLNRKVFGYDSKRSADAEVVRQQVARGGIGALAGFAQMMAPLAFNATSNLGKGGYVYLPVAEGGGSMETSTGFNYGMFPNLLPYHLHEKVGDVTDLNIIQQAGVGAILTRSDAEEYLAGRASYLGSTGMASGNLAGLMQGDRLIFNFDRQAKASQIPQRIKNVIGTRPLAELTIEYQQMLESLKGVNYQGRFGGLSGKVNTVTDLQAAYLSDLKAGVSQYKAHLIDERYGVGALYGGKIRSFLSREVASVLEQVRQELMEEFDQREDWTRTGVGAELFRARLVRMDIQDMSSIKGFTGSSERFGSPAVMLLQLTGAYGDSWFMNAGFGGEDGMRGGFVDTYTKGFMSSKLPNQLTRDQIARVVGMDTWELSENMLAQSGEVMATGKDDDRTWVYRYDPQTDTYVKNRIVDKRGEFALVGNIIDRHNGMPSIATVTATSNAARFAAEDSIEGIRDLQILPPNLTANEMQVGAVVDRTRKYTGGVRSESQSGGLFKGPGIMLTQDYFAERIAEVSKAGAWTNFEMNVRDIQGMSSPKNFKSYFFSHGSTLLTHKGGSMMKDLIQYTDDRVLAASILMGLGLSGDELNSTAGLDAVRSLARAANTGSLGQFYSDTYSLHALRLRSSDELEIGKAMLKEISRDRGALTEQLPSLRFFSLEQLSGALSGEVTALKDNLGFFFNHLDGEYIVDDLAGREKVMLAGAMEIYTQLSNETQQNLNLVRLDANESAYRMIGTEAGYAVKDLQDRRDEILPLLQHRANYSYMLRLFTPVASSQSKVGLSSRLTGRLELQHLMPASVTLQMDKFKKGGDLDAGRKFMAQILAAGTGMSAEYYLQHMQKMPLYDLTGGYLQSGDARSRAMGLYAGFMEDADLAQARNKFKLYSALKLITHGIRKGEELRDEDIAEIRGLIQQSKYSTIGEAVSGIENALKIGDPRKITEEMKSLVTSGFQSVMNEMEEASNAYRLYSGKVSGIDYQERAISSLKKSGWKTFMMAMPSQTYLNGKVYVHRERQNYALIPGAEMISFFGSQFGGFESEEGKLYLQAMEAFLPGTEVNKFFSQVAADPSSTAFEASPEVAAQIQSWENAVTTLQSKLMEGLAGDRMAQVFGNKISMDGGTFTPAALFGMPGVRTASIPSGLRGRFGGWTAQDRTSNLQKLKSKRLTTSEKLSRTQSRLQQASRHLGEVNKILNGPRDISLNVDSLRISSEYIDALEAHSALNDSVLNLRQREADILQQEQLYRYQIKMLERGVSQTGFERLSSLHRLSSSIKNQIDSARQHGSVDQLRDLLLEIDSHEKRYQSTKLNTRKASGDAYSQFAAIAEMQILKYDVLQELKGLTPGDMEVVSQLKDLEGRYKRLGKSSTVVQGLQLGRDNQSLKQLSLQSLEGEISKGSSSVVNSLRMDQMKLSKASVQRAINEYRHLANKQLKTLQEFEGAVVTGEIGDRFRKFTDRLSFLEQDLSKVVESNAGKGTSSRAHLVAITEDLEGEISRYQTGLAAFKFQAWRSAPLGQLESHMQKFVNISVGDLNSYFEGLRNEGYSPFKLDEGRNKALGLFNPVSFLVSNLGDYDGDSVTALLDYSDRMENDVIYYRRKIAELTDTARRGESKLKTAKDEDERITLSSDLEATRQKIKEAQRALKETRITLKSAKSTWDRSHFEQSARKWVSNYTKIDERFFLSREEGGWASHTADFATLMTYIEQGRGLADSMEEVGQISKDLDVLLRIGRGKKDQLTQDRFDGLLSSLQREGDTRVAETASFLLQDREQRDKILQAMQEAYGYEKGATEDERFMLGMQAYAVRTEIAAASNKEAQKLLGRGAGTAMAPEEFEMMLKTLGQAGSVILGKVYNSTLPIMFVESPLLAIAHAYEKDPQIRSQLEATLKEVERDPSFLQNNPDYDSLLRDPEGNFISSIDQLDRLMEQAKSRSRAIGGFKQSTEQMLRDSIKPKEMKKFFDEINEEMGNYNSAKDEHERAEVIDRIALKFGPGPGLRGVVQLEYLGKAFQVLNQESEHAELMQRQNDSLKLFQVDSQEEYSISKLLGFQEQLDGNNISRTEDGYVRFSRDSNLEGVSGFKRRALVAAYKTKRDLLATQASFIFEKNYNKGEGSGRSALAQVRDGYENMTVATEQDRKYKAALDQYSTWAEDYIRGSLDNTSFNLEKDEYIHALETNEFFKSAKDRYQSEGLDGLVSSDARLLWAENFLKTRSAMDPFTGTTGAGLLDLAEFNSVREAAYRGEFAPSRKLEIYDVNNNMTEWNWSMDSTVMSTMMAAAGGKIGPEHLSRMSEAMVLSYKRASGKNSATEAEVLDALMGASSFVNKTREGTQQLTLMRLAIRKNPKLAETMWKRVGATALGQMSQTLREFVEHAPDLAAQQVGDQEMISNYLKETGFSAEYSEKFIGDLRDQLTKSVVADDKNQSDLIDLVSKMQAYHNRPFVPPKTTDSSSYANKVLNTKNADIGFDALVVPVLGIVGAAIASGEVTPDVLQQAAGNSLMALAYSRSAFMMTDAASGNLNKVKGFQVGGLAAAATAGIGTAYKVRSNILAYEGDTGKALAATIAQEAAFAFTASVTSRLMQPVLNKTLGGEATVDFDRYDNIRSLTTNVITSAASAMVGMWAANTFKNMVMPINAPRTPNVVDASLKEAQKYVMEMQQMQNAEEVMGDVEVDSSAGDVPFIQIQSFGGDPEVNSAAYEAIYGNTQNLADDTTSVLGSDSFVNGYMLSLDAELS